MPKYTNPSDFLIKLAVAPYLVAKILTNEKLREKADAHYIKTLKSEESEFRRLTE
jgi:hypothetical protein